MGSTVAATVLKATVEREGRAKPRLAHPDPALGQVKVEERRYLNWSRRAGESHLQLGVVLLSTCDGVRGLSRIDVEHNLL